MMTNEEAIQILNKMVSEYPEDSLAAQALFLGVRTIAACTNQPYIQCKDCGKWYRRQIEEQAYDENDVVVYYCYCPYCGEEYEWNECYWR